MTDSETEATDPSSIETTSATASTEVVRLDWKVPATALEALKHHTREKYQFEEAVPYGRLAQELEMAMLEYIDADGSADAERRLREQIDESTDWRSEPHLDLDGEKARCTSYVAESVKERFARYSDRNSDSMDYHGDVLGRAIDEYVAGGRAERLDALTRALCDGSADQDQVDPDPEPDVETDGGEPVDHRPLSEFSRTHAREDKEAALAAELGMADAEGDVAEAEFRAAVDELAPGDTASDKTVASYRDVLLEEYDYVEHPTAPLYRPAGQLADDVDDVLEWVDQNDHASDGGAVARQHLERALAEQINLNSRDDISAWMSTLIEMTGATVSTGSGGGIGYHIPALETDGEEVSPRDELDVLDVSATTFKGAVSDD